MRVLKVALAGLVIASLGASSLDAATLAISIGIRETEAGLGASGGPVFSNAGTAGGIEFVNLDGQTLVADGTWQQFTFNPPGDTLTAFAGTTANGVLEGDWGALEMIRIRNIDGITLPIRLWIDELTNVGPTGPVVEGFEGHAVGTQIMFRQPSFSGSTSGNVVADPNTTEVSDTAAFAGSQSLQVDTQFVDDLTTRWIRLTTFGGVTEADDAALRNPAIYLRGETSFMMRAVVIPEPSSLVLLALGVVAAVGTRRRRLA